MSKVPRSRASEQGAFLMRVFITGAAGFIGTATTKELIANGHDVLGLARSDANAEALERLGAKVHRGSLEDLDSLRKGAQETDGTIHLAFIHDFRMGKSTSAPSRRWAMCWWARTSRSSSRRARA